MFKTLYFNRFKNHENSLKLETGMFGKKINVIDFELPEQCVKVRFCQFLRMITDRQLFVSFFLLQNEFLQSAIKTLLESRQSLMTTYVFAFFLENEDNNYRIFEDNQRDLEYATERLSGFLENNIDCIYNCRSDLIDKYR